MENVMHDETEDIRRHLVAQINTDPTSREALEAAHGQIWDTAQLGTDFEVLGFLAPFVVVKRKSDGVKGSLMFQHSPRFYYQFEPDR
jgi:hypothetical protein